MAIIASSGAAIVTRVVAVIAIVMTAARRAWRVMAWAINVAVARLITFTITITWIFIVRRAATVVRCTLRNIIAAGFQIRIGAFWRA